MNWKTGLLCLLAAALAVGGCRAVPKQSRVRLTVLAPDYLQGVIDRAAQQFTEENGILVVVSFENPDSLFARAQTDEKVDIVLSTDLRQFKQLAKDTLFLDRTYSCPFELSMVLAVRSRGPRPADISELAEPVVRRVVIVDPRSGYEGRLAEQVLQRSRVWKKLQKKLILANSTEHLLTFFQSGEADAAVMLESSLAGTSGVEVRQHLDRYVGGGLVHCGAVLTWSKNRESARAFLDLLDSRLCSLYQAPGVYLSEN
jgi:molybdate transport system substrate-binding protein